MLIPLSGIAGPSYRSVLKKWTKTGRAFTFETMDAFLIWDATLISEELLEARRKLAAERKIEVDEPDTSNTLFFINLYTHKYLKDFSMEPESTWKIYLVGADGVEVPATAIEPVKYDIEDRVFFPHVNPWSKPYFVRFPETELGKHPELIMRSLVAESKVRWNIK